MPKYIIALMLVLTTVGAMAQSTVNSTLTSALRRAQQIELIPDSTMTGTRYSQVYTMRRGVDSIDVYIATMDSSDVSLRIRSIIYDLNNAIIKSDTLNILALGTSTVQVGPGVRSIPWFVLKRLIYANGWAIPQHWRFELTYDSPGTPSYGTVSLAKKGKIVVREYVH